MKRVTTQEATCTEDGHTDGEVCSVCGKKTYTVIPAFGHDTETVQGYAATCTENGLTDGIECMRCGEWIQAQQTIQKTGHHWETYNGNDVEAGNHAATCTEPGLENQYCTNCGDRRSVTSDPLGHVKVVDVEAKDAKCFEDGCTEGWHCSRAGCNYRVESQTINMIGSHSYVARDAKEPTCTEGGWWPYDECTVCGDVFNVIPRDPLGHEFEDASTGEQLPTCARCGAVNPNY